MIIVDRKNKLCNVKINSVNFSEFGCRVFELHFSRKVPAVKKFDCMLERACTEVFFSEKMQFRHSSSVDRFMLAAVGHIQRPNDSSYFRD